MKQLQRLLFLQGNKCFFCGARIPVGEESVEHLDALSNGGKTSDENSVACCKTINAALGSLTVKEKFQAVLNHKGEFTCPLGRAREPKRKPDDGVTAKANKLLPDVVKNLRKRGTKRPNSLATLRNAIAGSFKTSPEIVEAVVTLLKKKGYINDSGGKMSYPGLQSKAYSHFRALA